MTPPSPDIFWISAADARRDYAVFYEHPAAGRPVLAAAYADLACRKCGKFEAIDALRRGITARPPKLTPDLMYSEDHVLLASDRARAALEATAPGTAEFFPIA